MEGHNLGVEYGAITIEYKILISQDHWSSNITYIKKLFCYGLMSMWLCALNFFPLNYIPWLNEDGIGVKICCRYFGIVVVVLLANSFVKMFDTITRMLFDTIAITYFFQVTKDKSKDDLKKLPYNAQLEFRFSKLCKHTNINDM